MLELIRQSDGLSRGEILERMGLKGDKSGEMSVSNALTALTKSNQVSAKAESITPPLNPRWLATAVSSYWMMPASVLRFIEPDLTLLPL